MNLDQSIVAKAKPIRLVIFDVDGVLTDGKLYYTDNGIECKQFHAQDGIGMKTLMAMGIEIGIITKRKTPIVDKRMKELSIKHYYQPAGDKVPCYEDLLSKLYLTPEQVAYVGDDVTDLKLIRRSGLGISVKNGLPMIKEAADYVTKQKGGKGAAREVCDLILLAQDLFERAYEPYQ